MPGNSSGRVFVDLSNVAKHELLGFSQHHAALSRWDRLRAAWTRERGDPVSFVLVADASLRRALSRADQRRLDGLERRGAVVVVEDADVELLRQASREAGTVVSNDRFIDHLKMPNLNGVTLVGWVVRGDSVLLQERSLERLRSAIISARSQKQKLKEMGLAENSPELAFRWYCREPTCENDLIAIPAMSRGSAACPACGAYIDRGAPWQHPLWLKLKHGEEEVNRFVLENGETTFVGRGTDDDIVSLPDEFDYASDVLALDLRHIELTNSGGQLLVRDLGGARGTALRYPVAGRRNLLSPPMPLPTDKYTTVSTGTKIVLGRTPFTIQISGQAGLG